MKLPCVVIIPIHDNKSTEPERKRMKPYSTNAPLFLLQIRIQYNFLRSDRVLRNFQEPWFGPYDRKCIFYKFTVLVFRNSSD